MKTIGSRRHRPERGQSAEQDRRQHSGRRQSAEQGHRPERGRIAEMYERYYNRLMVIACSYTGERAAAEDLVQEAFLKAILSYRAEGSFVSWAGKVIRNDYFNSRRREQRLQAGDIGEMPLEAGVDLLQDYIEKEERVKMAAMIASLPERYRDVMIDSVYLQEDNKTIAASRGISEENVRQLKSRAKKMLVQMKEKDEGENEGGRR